jgi:collagenase-like PrtC family protease
LRAAVGNGADAVYLGLSAYSARARATNFDAVEDLPKAVQYCHDAGVKVYVALNTLVFDSEFEEVSELIQLAYKARVDALIVQDLGVCKLARRIAPNLALHSSTQQTVTSSDGVAFCQEQHGATRVVLGRELSVEEIRQVSSEIVGETEVFVHGALCVSYSGQCFSSEAWGGRSANRGQCAQACRLPYGLIANGELIDLHDMKYLLSPQDLCGIDQVPALMKAGVSCLKIEGRLKDENYVAATTRAYRNAVDATWKAISGQDPDRIFQAEQVSRLELAQMFSRGQDEEFNGLTPGFLEGTHHQRLVRGRSPRHRGVHAGLVDEGSSPQNGLFISSAGVTDLKLGDGIVVDRGMAQKEELGGPIFDIVPLSEGRVKVQFSRDVIRKWKKNDGMAKKGIGKVLAPLGAHVWKTNDASVEKKMRRLSEALPPRKRVQMSVSGLVGTPLAVTIADGDKSVTSFTRDVLRKADKTGLNQASIIKAIGTLGDTQFAIDGDIGISELGNDVWCPVSWIKEARRQAVDEWLSLLETSEEPIETEIILGAPLQLLEESVRNCHSKGEDCHSKGEDGVSLSILTRNMDQVHAVCGLVEDRQGQIGEVIVDFLELEDMEEAVKAIRELGVKVVVASPRIIKPGESGIWRTLLRLEPDGLLVRSAGLLHRLMSLGGTGANVDVGSDFEHYVVIPTLYGDFSLNAANAISALELLHSGLERVTASYDLSANGISDMASLMRGQAAQLEVIIHAKIPVFHSEHCIFARFLSKGDSYLNCGHVCTRNNVYLRDETGADNLVLADMGCRNTVFSSQAQSGCHSINQWRDAGVRAMRIELVDESKNDSKVVILQYLGILAGTMTAREAWENLSQIKDGNGREGGVSLGSFNNKSERRAGALA